MRQITAQFIHQTNLTMSWSLSVMTCALMTKAGAKLESGACTASKEKVWKLCCLCRLVRSCCIPSLVLIGNDSAYLSGETFFHRSYQFSWPCLFTFYLGKELLILRSIGWSVCDNNNSLTRWNSPSKTHSNYQLLFTTEPFYIPNCYNTRLREKLKLCNVV